MNQANLELAKKLNRIAIVLSVIVIIVAASMHKIHIETSIDFSFLPKVYSTMNALAAVALIMALIFIKQGKIDLHKKSMTIALGMSILFLAMYVLYHLTNPHTLFCREGVIR